MGFQVTDFENDPAAKGIVSTLHTLEQVRDEQKKALFDPMSSVGWMTPMTAGGIIPMSEVASKARKGILNAFKMQIKGFSERTNRMNEANGWTIVDNSMPLDKDVIRRRYLELHQLPDELIHEQLSIEMKPLMEAYGEHSHYTKPGPYGTYGRGQIKVNSLGVSPSQNSTLHEAIHDATARGLGSNLEEQLKAKTIHRVNRQYQMRNEYKDTYSINPNENVARDVGTWGLSRLKTSSPGNRKIPFEDISKQYSESLNNNFKVSAMQDPGKTARGLMTSLNEAKAEIEALPNGAAKTEMKRDLQKAYESIMKEYKSVFSFK